MGGIKIKLKKIYLKLVGGCGNARAELPESHAGNHSHFSPG